MTQVIVCMTVSEADYLGEGWVVKLSAVGNLLMIERSIIVLQCRLDGIVPGVEGLDDDPATQYTPPGSAGHLGKKLEAPLSGAEIGQVEACIGANYSDQGNPGQIKSLGYHLGADKYIGFMLSKAVHDFLVAMFAMNSVTIPAQDSGSRECKAGFPFQFLGAGAEEL